jgi:multiple sugar transport system ATP-binding protein
VAGFIGSPAMNFLPAEVEGSTVKLPMVSFELPSSRRDEVGNRRNLIAGIRPEDFVDVALAGDGGAPGPTFKATIDVIEWMGSEQYAYFSSGSGGGHAGEMAQVAQELETVDTASAADQVVARLDAASTIKEGEEAELAFDPAKVHLFDPDTGQNLTVGRGGGGGGR